MSSCGKPGLADRPDDRESLRRTVLALKRFTLFLRAEFQGEGVLDALTIAQVEILSDLYEGALAMSTIAQRRGLSRTGTTEIVDRLVARGFVERNGNPSDRRLTLVKLTPRGRELAATIRWRTVDRMSRIVSRMTAEQRRALLEGLAAVDRVLAGGDLET